MFLRLLPSLGQDSERDVEGKGQGRGQGFAQTLCGLGHRRLGHPGQPFQHRQAHEGYHREREEVEPGRVQGGAEKRRRLRERIKQGAACEADNTGEKAVNGQEHRQVAAAVVGAENLTRGSLALLEVIGEALEVGKRNTSRPS